MAIALPVSGTRSGELLGARPVRPAESLLHRGTAVRLRALRAAAEVRLRTLRVRDRFPLVDQLVRFTVVGASSTVLNALVYLLLRLVFGPLASNLVALLVSTAASTELHRRFTFDGAPRSGWRAGVQDAGTIAFYAGYSTMVLMLVDALVADPTPLLESAAVTAASVLGGLARFALLKIWVFRTR